MVNGKVNIGFPAMYAGPKKVQLPSCRPDSANASPLLHFDTSAKGLSHQPVGF